MPQRKKLTAEQIIGKLREAEVEAARGRTVLEGVKRCPIGIVALTSGLLSKTRQP